MPFRFSFTGGGGVSLKTVGSWGSEGSCHSDSASKVGVGSLQKQIVVGVVRVVAIKIYLQGWGWGLSKKTENRWGSEGSCH